MNFPIDMAAYILVVEAVSLWWLLCAERDDKKSARYVVLAQLSLIAVFWLVWGGYSTDAWRYLSRFPRDPFSFEEEQLFWLLGHGLSGWLPDPWPLKLLSALSALAYCGALVAHYRRGSPIYVILSLSVVLVAPGFFLLFGNAIRQGLAGTVLILGMFAFLKGRYLLFGATVVIAFFLHQPSIIFAAAILASCLPRRWIGVFLVVAPLVSFAANYGLGIAGVDTDLLIRYSHYHEGDFHWVKFVVAYSVAWLLMIVKDRLNSDDARAAVVYVCAVAASSLFLKYEVPFERALLFSDLLLPVVAVSLLQLSTRVVKRAELVAWGGIVAIGSLLWSHPSIVATLGYRS